VEFERAIERLIARKSEELWARSAVTVERSVVDRFCEAIGWRGRDADDIPVAVIAHLFRDSADVHRDERPRETIDDALVNPMNGGTEFEFHRRPRIGEMISAQSILKDVYSRQGKSGPLGFVVTETNFFDAAGSPIAAQRVTMIYRGVA